MNRLSDRTELAELAPVLQRVAAVDPASLARVRVGEGRVAVLVRLPFNVLVARSVTIAGEVAEPTDVTVRTDELLAWLDGHRADPPAPHDADWRWGSPPVTGWRRVDTVPGDVVRDLVRKGAQALDDAGPGEHRQHIADALLDSVVLTVASDDATTHAEVSLRTLSALTRMGFLPPDSHVAVDVAGRWTRVAAAYGSVYAERAGAALSLL